MAPRDKSENPNPIVAMAMRIRARKDIEAAIDSATPNASAPAGGDTATSLEAFGAALAVGAKRLNAVLGKNAMTYVRLENPLRIRLRFKDKRIAFDLDERQALVVVRGLGLDGEHQFDTDVENPGLINLSILSTDAGYGNALRPSDVLKAIAQDAELPRPAHLDSLGPLNL
jgi:hypothetical protein